MSEFVVFAEMEAFEKIIFNDTYPTLRNVFTSHASVYMNMSELDIDANIHSEEEIFYFLHAYAGAKKPKSYIDQFDNVYDDGANVVNTPRSLYFLNMPSAKANELQEKFGVIVQSTDAINDDFLKGTYYRELPRGYFQEHGWKSLVDNNLPPSNAIIITDDWLFKNVESEKIVGQKNIIAFLDAILPIILETEYHVLIITDDQEMSDIKCEDLARNLKEEMSALRNYEVIFELVFAETIHKRKAIMNYVSITCDKGFGLFKLLDLKTVRDDNDFRLEKSFNRVDPSEGDTVFYSDALILKKVREKCESVKQYIKNLHQGPNQRILGDCNPDKSIKNRLINDV